MAALVQTLPPQTVTMIQGQPSSPKGFASPHHQPRNAQKLRYHNASSSGSYRGLPSGPVAPYAFTATPQLANTNNTMRTHTAPHLRSDNRSVSAPVLPQMLASAPNLNSVNISSQRNLNSDMSALSSNASLLNRLSSEHSTATNRMSFPDFANWPEPSFGLTAPASATTTAAQAPKPSPDRYRRTTRRVDSGESAPNRVHSAMPSGSGMAAVGPLYTHPAQANSSPALSTYLPYRENIHPAVNPIKHVVSDDMTLSRPQNVDAAKQHRRRSLGSLETAGLDHSEDVQQTVSPHPNTFIAPPGSNSATRDRHVVAPPQRPTPSHHHNGSSESVSSTRSSRSQRPGSTRNDAPKPALAVQPNPIQVTSVSKQDVKIVNIPQRTTDSARRNPSPLSRPVNLAESAQNDTFKKEVSNGPPAVSPAAEQLASLNLQDGKKPKSKLRRAFSFGSATELRRATAQHNLEKNAAAATTTVPKRSSKHQDELDPEQAKIAEKQEAGGIGQSIYSGQGHFFTGSTDNLSVSSTASSASLMLRKMGKGVKKSGRSLVGLFRPKSVIGVPAADGPVNQASAAQVSMVTVEAEREKVNVNVNPHDQPGGGTGFPKLERNSIDAKLSTDSGTASTDTRSRRSIVGGERERAEVLAAVKKGILKRTDSSQSSPITRPLDFRSPDFNLPQIPHINDSPRSSAPSTPADDHPPRSGHRRTDSITIEGTDPDDYFTSITRYASLDSKGVPLTPRAAMARNISFSPRIQFHDTWPSTDYDRRGEVATCNRLTPMLAQQIKEELNTFKMEMEVHESSKVYTHFF